MLETGLAQILGKLRLIYIKRPQQYPLTLRRIGTIPGMHMVDIFTWLDYLPLFLKPWERDARKRFKRDIEWCTTRLEV
jgi:hypothetical protein